MSTNNEPTQAPGGKMRRIALTAKEEAMIADYRRKTEADRAFNDGLDHALECLPNVPDTGGVPTYDEWFGTMMDLRSKIEAARRDV